MENLQLFDLLDLWIRIGIICRARQRLTADSLLDK